VLFLKKVRGMRERGVCAAHGALGDATTLKQLDAHGLNKLKKDVFPLTL
jgi:hypothetical protein